MSFSATFPHSSSKRESVTVYPIESIYGINIYQYLPKSTYMFLNMPYMDPMDILEFFSYPERQQSDSILNFLWCFWRKTSFSLEGNQCGLWRNILPHIWRHATFTTGSLESQALTHQPKRFISWLSKAISTVFLFWFFSFQVPGEGNRYKLPLENLVGYTQLSRDYNKPI